MTRTVNQSGAILITGAAGGIGQALALRLLDRGDQVVATARRQEDLSGLASGGAITLSMDVGKDESVREAFRGLPALRAVVHCAAIAPVGTVEFTSSAAVAEVINVNTLGGLRVLQSAAPILRETRGRLILVSSLWGQVAGPLVSTYAASKHALEALADSARREMGSSGPDISIVEPGVVKTSMYYNQTRDLDAQVDRMSTEEQRLYGRLYQTHRNVVVQGGKGAITPEQCVRVIEKALDARRSKTRYTAGTDAKLVVALGRLLSDRGLDRVFRAIYRDRPS